MFVIVCLSFGVMYFGLSASAAALALATKSSLPAEWVAFAAHIVLNPHDQVFLQLDNMSLCQTETKVGDSLGQASLCVQKHQPH